MMNVPQAMVNVPSAFCAKVLASLSSRALSTDTLFATTLLGIRRTPTPYLCSTDAPLTKNAVSAPKKQSPAPVESTTCEGERENGRRAVTTL